MPFDSLSASLASAASHAPGSKRRKPAALTQASDIQYVIYQATQALNDADPESDLAETRARVLQALASGAKGWQAMNAQIREMTGLGKPKPVEPVNAGKAKTRRLASPVLLDDPPAPPA